MKIRSTLSFLVSLLVFGATSACDETPDSPPVGSLGITTTMPQPQFTTADGWAITINHYLVNVASVSVAGVDRVLAASATAQLLDLAAPGPKPLVTASVRTARPWEEVGFVISPVTSESQLVAPVSDANKEMMIREGLSIWVEGSALNAGILKQFQLGFATDTTYRDCAGERDGAFVRGLIVPANGDDTADVGIDPSVLFLDDLRATGALPRAAAVVAADRNNDNIIVTNELRGVTLDAAKAIGGLYGTGDTPGIDDLGAFVGEQTRRVVASFRAKGACIPTATTPAP